MYRLSEKPLVWTNLERSSGGGNQEGQGGVQETSSRDLTRVFVNVPSFGGNPVEAI